PKLRRREAWTRSRVSASAGRGTTSVVEASARTRASRAKGIGGGGSSSEAAGSDSEASEGSPIKTHPSSPEGPAGSRDLADLGAAGEGPAATPLCDPVPARGIAWERSADVEGPTRVISLMRFYGRSERSRTALVPGRFAVRAGIPANPPVSQARGFARDLARA